MFVACGEVLGLEISNFKLVAKTDKEYLFDLISANNNLLAIKRSLRFLGFDLGFEIVKIESRDHLEKQDIEKLKEKFKDKLIVED